MNPHTCQNPVKFAGNRSGTVVLIIGKIAGEGNGRTGNLHMWVPGPTGLKFHWQIAIVGSSSREMARLRLRVVGTIADVGNRGCCLLECPKLVVMEFGNPPCAACIGNHMLAAVLVSGLQ